MKAVRDDQIALLARGFNQVYRHVIAGIGASIKGNGINDAQIASDYLRQQPVAVSRQRPPRGSAAPLEITSTFPSIAVI